MSQLRCSPAFPEEILDKIINKCPLTTLHKLSMASSQLRRIAIPYLLEKRLSRHGINTAFYKSTIGRNPTIQELRFLRKQVLVPSAKIHGNFPLLPLLRQLSFDLTSTSQAAETLRTGFVKKDLFQNTRTLLWLQSLQIAHPNIIVQLIENLQEWSNIYQ